MSVNLSNDPANPSNQSSIAPSHSIPNLKNEPPIENYSTKQDSVGIAPSQETSNLTENKSHVPNLSAPESSDMSIIGAYRSWIEAAREFRNQLSASEAANLTMRKKFIALSVNQCLEFSKMLAEKEAAIASLQKEVQESLSNLEQQFQEMQSLTKQQQSEIDTLNAGNEQEKQEYKNLNNAYERYLAQLNKIGVVDKGNGNYVIPDQPPEVLEQYNQFTQEYQQAVNTFNTYWAGRSQQIDKYNKNTLIYNQKVAEYNKGVNEFISQNDLADYLKAQNINLPQMTQATRRDLSGYQDQIGSPSHINAPASIYISPPPYVKTIAQTGPSALSQLVNLSSFKAQTLYNELYHKKYEEQITPLENAAQQYINYNTFINRQLIQNLDDDLSFNNLLNTKEIQKLLSIKSKASLLSSTDLMIKTLGLESANLQFILGKILLREAFNQSQLAVLSKLNGQEKQARLDELSDKMLLLSIGLLGNQSLQALFPSLGIISETLPALPKNDPVFAILFAVSFCNRIGEDIEHGLSSTALENFVNANPELAELSPAAKQQLEASINIGQLLVSSKLLEESLGLPGLLTHLFPPLSPVLNPDRMITQANQADQQTEIDLQGEIKDNFIEKGYPEEKAQFFAQLGTELIRYGLMAPHVNANIQEKTIDYSLLKNSIKTEIALSPDKTLQEADALANEALSRTFDNQPFPSAKQFRSILQSHLTDLKVQKSSEIAMSAVLIPPLEQSLNRHPSVLTPPLSSPELIAIVEKRTLQLLTPQLGTQPAKEISQEIITTLFGKPKMSSHDVGEIKSPYALVNVIKEQLYHLNAENNQNWAQAIHETFTESLKTVTSFYEFSKKLQSPAYQYIRAFSIIHGDQNQSRKNAIDIPI